MRADELLDAAERMRIETAVHDIEASTSGEIVVCVVDSCGEYGSAGWRFGCVLAALTLLGVAWGWPDVSATALLAAQTVALAVAHALGRIQIVRRWLLQDTLIEQSVRARAARAFAEHGLAGTKARTGILILVAVLERRVVVLADEGIERALTEGESWQDVVDLATAGLRQKRAADGIEAAVRRCGEILSRVSPQIGTPVDELPRSVIVEG